MNGLVFWITLAAAEVALAAFVLLLIYWIRNMRAARRDREAVTRLVKEASKQKTAREAEIATFLADEMGLEGDGLSKTTATILREELRLVQAFASIYSDRDSRSAAKFRLNIEQAVAPYYSLRGTVVSGGTADTSEIEALRRENARLSEELTVTMDTMSRMLTEYSGIFASEDNGEPPPVEKPVSAEFIAPPLDEEQGDANAAADATVVNEVEVAEPEPEAINEEVTVSAEPEPEATEEVAAPVKAEAEPEPDPEVVPEVPDAAVVSIPLETIKQSDGIAMDLESDAPEASVVEAPEPERMPVEEHPLPEMEQAEELPSESMPVDEQAVPEANEVVELALEGDEVLPEPVDLGEVVELVPEEPDGLESQEAAVDLMAEPVNEEELDSLIQAGPLEEELGDLFDSDDIAVLDDLPEEAGDDQLEKNTIAI